MALCISVFELQNAIQSEKYYSAVDLRVEISKLEAESLAASVKAQRAFRLAQRLKHKLCGYRAIICGMDPICCESKSWMEDAKIDKLIRGPDQPFYQDSFDRPYASFSFYGMDGGGGDFIPIKQLRQKYIQPGYELPYNPQDEDDVKDA